MYSMKNKFAKCYIIKLFFLKDLYIKIEEIIMQNIILLYICVAIIIF